MIVKGFGETSELFDSESGMAPKSGETLKVGRFPFLDDTMSKEKQRPPIYNPEDYAILLKKWGRKSVNGMISLYSSACDLDGHRSQRNSFKDYRNPMLISSGSEMTLRQFGTVSELLAKLKSDLRLAYPSFVQEFVADPLDGVTLLLDLLRAIQLSQSNTGHCQPGSSSTTGRMPPSLQRRTLLDELSCLQCLLNCCLRYSEAVRKLTSSSAGLFTLAICIMSNVNKSRIIALQLLTKACEPPTNGNSSVSEAMSTLRLRFGEPVRFRFLVGMLISASGQKELLTAGMKFLNTFLNTTGSKQRRLYVQAELEQAGFDLAVIKKNIGEYGHEGDPIFSEMDNWEKHHIDVETLTIRLGNAERENDKLKDKVLLLERKIQILQEEKGILVSLEQCLKERCSELQEEMRSLKSDKSHKGSTYLSKRKDGSTPDDEGISSSEHSSTPNHPQQRSPIYEIYSLQHCDQPPESKDPPVPDDEDDTTIDEVIEELRNIINDAEIKNFNEEKLKAAEDQERIEKAQVAAKLQLRLEVDDYAIAQEREIIPSDLHPQPPRRTRSLVHLFAPSDDYEFYNKELFFENGTAFTSEESSDSLLSASKCFPPRINGVIFPSAEKRNTPSKCKRSSSKTSIKRSESFRRLCKATVPPKQDTRDGSADNNNNSPTKYIPHKEKLVTKYHTKRRMKSKSLDRIGDGLDKMVDIVVQNHLEAKQCPLRSKSDSGAISGTYFFGESHNLPSSNKVVVSKLSNHSEDKQRMFLPASSNQNEIPYYFPRIHEKKSSTSSSFLIRRGHGNAGLYSGQIVVDHHHISIVNSKDVVASGNCRSNSKVTDLLSGLY